MKETSRLRALFAGFRPRSIAWAAAVVVAAVTAMPGAADAKAAHAAGYDGSWNVLIITQAGTCDQIYSFPVQIVGGRIASNAATANVTGLVGRGGSVAVRVSSGGSFATGTGRLGLGSGAGRWSGRGSAGVCSGRWEATRS